LLELHAVRPGLAGYVEALPAVAGDEVEVPVAERDRLPLLVRPGRGADAPELDLGSGARGPRSTGHVPAQPRREAHHHPVVPAVGRLELPFLVVLSAAARRLDDGRAVGRAPSVVVTAHAVVRVLVC